MYVNCNNVFVNWIALKFTYTLFYCKKLRRKPKDIGRDIGKDIEKRYKLNRSSFSNEGIKQKKFFF